MEVSQHPCLPKEFALSAHYYWHTVCSDFYDFGIFRSYHSFVHGILFLHCFSTAADGCMPSIIAPEMMGRVRG